MIVIGILLVVLIELSLLGWAGRPRRLGRIMLWVLLPGFVLVVAKYGQDLLPEEWAGWVYFALAVLFAVAVALAFSVDQPDIIRRKAKRGQTFSHSGAVKVLVLGLFFMGYGVYDDSWYLLIFGGGAASGMAVAILWDSLLPARPAATKGGPAA